MSIIKRLFSLPLLVIQAVFIWIVYANFPYGKFFIGWDALNPEFYFKENFVRVWSSFWQENQGLGLLGGHGFAATLPHTIITFLFSFVLPIEAIRPAVTFLMLYIGTIGLFFLSKKILQSVTHHLPSKNNADILPWFACISALFYMLNLGTLQMFYIQLEAFIFHFAFLPWLLLSALNMLEKPNRKNMLLFGLVNFFASTQGFIPPLFVAYMVSLGILLIGWVFHNKRSLRSFKQAGLIIGITLCINAYWLTPLAYYTVTRSDIYLNSYNNLLSTPEFIEKNRKYGDIEDVPSIRGFIWEGVDSTTNKDIYYVFQPWRDHFDNPFVPLLGYTFFGISLFGLLYTLVKIKDWTLRAMAGIFLFFFTGLTTNFPPFSLITRVLQELPIYKQAFRAAFTKFSIGVSFSYSLFLGIGLLVLYSEIKNKSWFHKFTYSLVLPARNAIIGTLFLFVILYSFPTFSGHFLYKRLTLNIPHAYLDIMDYFKNKEDARILELPMECPDGWYNFLWGYTGSGFYWYGIKQPILSRTFDVWSNKNENFYWEFNQAARLGDFSKIDKLIEKYDIKWVLFDPNIVHCRDPKALLHYDDVLEHLKSSPLYTQGNLFTSAHILPIRLFEAQQHSSNSFISIRGDLPNVGPVYKWNDNDLAYYEYSDYITDPQKNYTVAYPFRSLFGKRKTDEREVQLEATNNEVHIRQDISNLSSNGTLYVPSLAETETLLPVELTIIKNDLLYDVLLTYLPPEISIGNEKYTASQTIKLGTLPTGSKTIFINGRELAKGAYEKTVRTMLSLTTNNTIEIVNTEDDLLLSWNSNQDSVFSNVITASYTIPYRKGVIDVAYPTISDELYGRILTSHFDQNPPRPCNEFTPSNGNDFRVGSDQGQEYIRLESVNGRQCLTLNYTDLSTSNGYVVSFDSRKLQGNDLSFYISNAKKVHYLDIHLTNNNVFKTNSFIIPPSFKGELGYDIYFDNYSKTENKTINDVKNFRIWTIPYNFLSKITLVKYENEISIIGNNLNNTDFSVIHNDPTHYFIALPEKLSKNTTLILSQSYDSGWLAYETPTTLSRLFPIFFGKPLTNHVLVNNWENGWLLSDQSSVISKQSNKSITDNRLLNTDNRKLIAIVYWPQYLEYIGFGLLGLGLIFVTRLGRIEK